MVPEEGGMLISSSKSRCGEPCAAPLRDFTEPHTLLTSAIQFLYSANNFSHLFIKNIKVNSVIGNSFFIGNTKCGDIGNTRFNTVSKWDKLLY